MTTLNKVSPKEYLTTIRDNLVEQLENNPNKWQKCLKIKICQLMP
jgi:hypothetical protein